MSVDAPKPDWMVDNRKIVRVTRGMDHFGVDFLIGTKTHIGAPVVYKPTENDDITYVRQPTFTLETEEAQKLMDELWNCGIRPSDGEGSMGQVAALKKHIEDLRKIVFRDLNIEE